MRSDCPHCHWHNIYATCQDGSRELERYEHMRDEHPEADR